MTFIMSDEIKIMVNDDTIGEWDNYNSEWWWSSWWTYNN